jgi:hypothetical protein
MVSPYKVYNIKKSHHKTGGAEKDPFFSKE